MRYIYVMVFLLVLPNFVRAETFTLRECNELASEVNAVMSNMQVDSITILRNAVCFPPATLNYYYDLTIVATEDDIDFAILKRNNTQTWCTDPNMRLLLDSLTSVAYTYRDKNGTYIGQYAIKKSECS